MNRRYTQLTDIQRHQIDAYLTAGMPKHFIVCQLGISRTTLYRELNRNSSKTGKYNAVKAQILCQERKERYGRNRKFTKN